MKKCTTCNIEKDQSEFNKQSDTKDGLTYKCKMCATAATKVWADRNREYLREYNNRRYADNPGPKKLAAKKYREANLERSRENNRLWRIKNKEYVRGKILKKLYGLSIEAYERMYREQNGCCKICEKQNLDGKRLFVDHDHNTGTVRGLLCHHCNAGIGHFFDDPFLFQAAIKYITENTKESV